MLSELDHLAKRLEKDNKEVLQEKIKGFCKGKQKNFQGKSLTKLNNQENEKERQIFSFFAELKATDELREQGFNDIHFIGEENKKTPDISAMKNGKQYFIEVKRIQNPRDEDENLRLNKYHESEVNINFRKPLKNKIRYFIKDAKEKFQNSGSGLTVAQKTLVLDFEPGIDARLSIDFSKTNLENIFDENFFSELESKNKIKIWTRKYF